MLINNNLPKFLGKQNDDMIYQLLNVNKVKKLSTQNTVNILHLVM